MLFHSILVPWRRITTVLGLSNTDRRGTPPKTSNDSRSARTSGSTRSLGTIRTWQKRENFSREAKKWSVSFVPSS